MTAARVARLALALGGLAACAPGAAERADRERAERARAARARADSLAAVVAVAEREGRALRASVGGRPVALLVDDCAVYELEPDGGRGRDPVLEPEAYPWPTVCARQAVRAESGWVLVTLGRTAFGAGGCCASGGTYRSRDGRAWEREGRGGRWAAVAAGAAPGGAAP